MNSRLDIGSPSCSMTRTIRSSFNRNRCRTAIWNSFNWNRCRTARGTNCRSASSTFTAKKFHDSNESDDVEEKSDEDDVKKPVINVKLKRSGRVKERRKSRRKLESKSKNELSIISTAMVVKGQDMMLIRKHVILTVQGDRSTETRTK